MAKENIFNGTEPQSDDRITDDDVTDSTAFGCQFGPPICLSVSLSDQPNEGGALQNAFKHVCTYLLHQIPIDRCSRHLEQHKDNKYENIFEYLWLLRVSIDIALLGNNAWSVYSECPGWTDGWMVCC